MYLQKKDVKCNLYFYSAVSSDFMHLVEQFIENYTHAQLFNITISHLPLAIFVIFQTMVRFTSGFHNYFSYDQMPEVLRNLTFIIKAYCFIKAILFFRIHLLNRKSTRKASSKRTDTTFNIVIYV